MATAVIKIQAGVRGMLVRRKLRLTRNAAKVIQKAYRTFIEKRIRERAVTSLQAFVRMWALRSRFALKKIAAIKIQTWFRHRKALMEYKRIKSAASTIQSHWRATIRGRQVRDNLKLCRRSVHIIQNFLRKAVIQRRKWRYDKSVVVFQAHCKGFLVRCENQRREAAASKIQEWWIRVCQGKTERVKFEETRNEIIIITYETALH